MSFSAGLDLFGVFWLYGVNDRLHAVIKAVGNQRGAFQARRFLAAGQRGQQRLGRCRPDTVDQGIGPQPGQAFEQRLCQ